MKTIETLKELAENYLREVEPAKKWGILMEAENLLKAYNYTTKTKLFNDLQISYFASVNSSQKIVKGEKLNFDTLILYLSASKNAGVDLCKFASTGCRLACLVESGHSLISSRSGKYTIQISRIVKSWLCIYRKDIANEILKAEIETAKKRAEKRGKKFAVRLNGTSDIEFYDVINAFKDVQFYDYTKDFTRHELPNYHLTFSYSNDSKARIKHYKDAIRKGQSIAFPVLASDYQDAIALRDCYDMDSTDLRFLDNKGKYGILKVKLNDNLQDGIKNKFILSLDELKTVIETIEN